MEPLDDLKNTLSMALLDAPYDINGYTEEHERIRGLASVVQQMEDGSMTPQEVSEVFRNQNIPDFDFHSWFQEWVDAGVYTNHDTNGGN